MIHLGRVHKDVTRILTESDGIVAVSCIPLQCKDFLDEWVRKLDANCRSLGFLQRLCCLGAPFVVSLKCVGWQGGLSLPVLQDTASGCISAKKTA